MIINGLTHDMMHNSVECNHLMPLIHEYICKHGRVNMGDISVDIGCDEIPMCLAIHTLVIDELIDGVSPYIDRRDSQHDYSYEAQYGNNNTQIG